MPRLRHDRAIERTDSPGLVCSAKRPEYHWNRTGNRPLPGGVANNGSAGYVIGPLVLRFRSSHHFAAPSRANFGIKGALASICFQCGFGFEVPILTLPHNLIGTSNPPHWHRILTPIYIGIGARPSSAFRR